ncbi:MAG: hypothetical protein ABSG32_30100 [Terriglobia bacterium]|jgi:hypothetical protein
MIPNFTIEPTLSEGVIEITATYPEFAISDAGFDEPFRKQLVQSYEKLAQTQENRDCILTLKVKVAGSPVVKAIYELWKVVRARSGFLILADYPPNYVRALTDLGLPSLPGFDLVSDTNEARQKMVTRRAGREHKNGAQIG